MDPGGVSLGVQGSPSPGVAERGEENGGCNRSDGLPPVPRTPSLICFSRKPVGLEVSTFDL
jgi:hypothetical protein